MREIYILILGKIIIRLGITLVAIFSLTGQSWGVSAWPDKWEDWVEQNKESLDHLEYPAVQNRNIQKAQKFQILGPALGISERKDFYNIYFLSFGVRRHWSESLAWEPLRVTRTYYKLTQTAREVQEKTSFRPDSQTSLWQLSTSIIFSPVYGKFVWNRDHLYHFDVYTLGGLGVRFARERQVFAEFGLGMNHFIWANNISIVPEFKFRVYQEQRTEKVTVFESLYGIGLSWYF